MRSRGQNKNGNEGGEEDQANNKNPVAQQMSYKFLQTNQKIMNKKVDRAYK